ncbi:MAG: energy transducer TonB [Stenotrophomonas sp.]
MMRSPLFLALVLATGSITSLACADAAAQTAQAVRATAEASMVLTGNIDVSADGSVSHLVLDQREMITPSIASFVDGTIRSWRFEPTLRDGASVPVHAPLRVRLLGKPSGDGGIQVRMSSVDFSQYDDTATDTVTRKRMPAPRYPEAAFRGGAQGDVLLLVKVARDGTVADVIAEQVNMGVVAPERTMQQLRDLFAKASITAARKWTFAPPTTGEDKDHADWTIRIPVSYSITKDLKSRPEDYGTWKAFIPGPRQSAPWRQHDVQQAGSDLLPAGGVYMVDSANRGLRLLTPLSKD